MLNRQLYLHARPQGIPTPEHIHLREVPVSRPGPGQVLLENLYLSMDPAIRGWMSEKASYFAPIALGEAIRGSTLGRVIESRHPDFREGDHVVGIACNAWEDFSVVGGEQVYKVSTDNGFPLNYHVSIFSAVGLTPYFGVLEIGKPQLGETALISAAAGACGSLAGQIAKLKGCRVVGIAGSDEKCRWIVEELGFDAAINYKTCGDLTKAVADAFPKGIDVYFENVGGKHLEAAINAMRVNGRAALCGMIEQYNDTEPRPGPTNLIQIVGKSLRLQGFIVSNYFQHLPEFFAEMGPLIKGGKMKWEETVEDGIENAPKAFLNLFKGANFGKMLVKIGPDKAV
ncbi:NADP-dependent oxidoreductase [Pseudomonas sp.]|uniref:NADP-dependent oxidoreductase n=1 Tax=Pseudomonas sp. TaxID=306 RepID=UPI0027315B0F|nr:NADP-dependent oxidoreductase [Pseudomonas sp.]MDP2243768.1 NADP-dependent oxidoreductase [Pseudomonas sp.]